MVDLATLTGAMIISLGHEYAGLFSNSDPLSEAITALQALGYKPADADRMAKKAAAEGDDTPAIIRKALQSALR